MTTGHHRAGHKLHGRYVGGRRTHQLGWNCLVATTDQNHRVHWLRANHLLSVHGHEVPVDHAGWV